MSHVNDDTPALEAWAAHRTYPSAYHDESPAADTPPLRPHIVDAIVSATGAELGEGLLRRQGVKPVPETR